MKPSKKPEFRKLPDSLQLQQIIHDVSSVLDLPAACVDSSGQILAAMPDWQHCDAFPTPDLGNGAAGSGHCRMLNSPSDTQHLPPDIPCYEISCPGGCSALGVPVLIARGRTGVFFLGRYRLPERTGERRELNEDFSSCAGNFEKTPLLTREQALANMGRACRQTSFFNHAFHSSPEKGVEKVSREISPGLFQALFDQTPDPLYVIDLSGKVIEANQAACEKFGMGRKGLLSLSLENLLPPAEIGKARYQMDEIVRQGSTVFETACSQGLAIEVSCRYFDFDGRRAILAQVKDIEGRKKADDALRKSEERFRSVFEQSNVAMTLVSPQGRFLQVNSRFCDFLGYLEKEILSFFAWDVSIPEDRETVRQAFENYLKGEEKTLNLERRYLRKDGTMCWGSVAASMIYGLKGEPLYSIGVIEDITRQKKAEETMHRALVETAAGKDRIDAIVGSIKDGLIATDIHDRIILMNGAAEELLEVRFEDAENKSLERLIHSVMPAKKPAIHPEVETREFILENTGGDSTRHNNRALHFKFSPIVTRKGEKLGRIAVLRDITREREIDRMKNEFISTAAHELRTPLTSVKGFSEILMGENNFNDDQTKEFISYIYANSEVLEKIVNDLFDLSRVESGRIIQLKKTEGNICSLLNRIVSQYQKEHGCHNFETLLPTDIFPLWFDREKIFQVMENLLSNAVKFSPQESSILTSCAKKGSEVVVSVVDQGIGMTPGEVEKIFDKFYRVDSSDTAVAGLGLGMAIAKSIIEAHFGRIWVDSQPGCGTTVSFTLPLPHCLQKS